MTPDLQCRTFVPTNPGTEGLGEGSIVQATNGDIISMSWFPYPGGDLKLDKFYAILYDDSEMEWKWCYNRITEPFYDRSWQVEVVIQSHRALETVSGLPSSFPISGINRKTLEEQISVDGLNYYPIQFPGRSSTQPDIDIDLDFTNASLDFYWDVNKPHKEMRALQYQVEGCSSHNTLTMGTQLSLTQRFHGTNLRFNSRVSIVKSI